MTMLAVIDCYIGNGHPTTGCHGINAFLNDLTTIHLGAILLHGSPLALVTVAAAAWAFHATRSEASFPHSPDGERAVSHAYWLTALLGIGAAIWLILPEQGFQFYNAIWLHLGGHSA
jgi:hypothetical protein